MKKKHPCGGDVFKVLRVGSDVRDPLLPLRTRRYGSKSEAGTEY